MAAPRRTAGFSLLELLIALALMAVLTAVAATGYSGYLETAREARAEQAAASLAVAQEAHHLRHDRYASGEYHPSGARTLTTGSLGWSPAGEVPLHFEVGPCADTDLDRCYRLSVTRVDTGATVLEREVP
ncbi:MAG: prepilin-type N-terminal cleavage/methylation domain-containing protein [Pseudomonadota bacterium]